MKTDVVLRELLTPEQAAEYLQINRETVYRYIRDGKLIASRLGRTYRISRASIEMFLWEARTRDVPLRECSDQEIHEFLKRDELGLEAREVVRQIGKTERRQGGGKGKKTDHSHRT